MSRPVLAAIAAKAKSLGLLTGAVLAGGTLAGVLATGSASGATAPSPSHAHSSHPPDAPDTQDTHGQCVSKVARNHDAVGGPHHNHGGAVSAAAHSCPHS